MSSSSKAHAGGLCTALFELSALPSTATVATWARRFGANADGRLGFDCPRYPADTCIGFRQCFQRLFLIPHGVHSLSDFRSSTTCWSTPWCASDHTLCLTSPVGATDPSFFTFLSPAFFFWWFTFSLAVYCFFIRFAATVGFESSNFRFSPRFVPEGPPPGRSFLSLKSSSAQVTVLTASNHSPSSTYSPCESRRNASTGSSSSIVFLQAIPVTLAWISRFSISIKNLATSARYLTDPISRGDFSAS